MVRVAALVIIAALFARTAGAQEAPVWEMTIRANGWIGLDLADDAIVFTRPAVTLPGSPYRRQWSRYEFNAPQNLALFLPTGAIMRPKTEVYLQEFDCSQLRSRALAATYYSENNMGGDIVSRSPGSAEGWSYETPGTLGEKVAQKACSLRPPPRR